MVGQRIYLSLRFILEGKKADIYLWSANKNMGDAKGDLNSVLRWPSTKTIATKEVHSRNIRIPVGGLHEIEFISREL